MFWLMCMHCTRRNIPALHQGYISKPWYMHACMGLWNQMAAPHLFLFSIQLSLEVTTDLRTHTRSQAIHNIACPKQQWHCHLTLPFKIKLWICKMTCWTAKWHFKNPSKGLFGRIKTAVRIAVVVLANFRFILQVTITSVLCFVTTWTYCGHLQS